MTSIRFTRNVKSAIAGAVSLSLFLGSAGWPASQAFAQAVSASRAAEGASPVLALPVSGSAALIPSAALLPAAASLGASLPAASAPAASRAAALPALAPAALPASLPAPAFSAGRLAAPAEGAKPAAPAPVEPAAAPAPVVPQSEGGPRWVESDGSEKPAKDAESGPRWVKTGLKSWIGQQLAHWAKADAAVSRREFDGDHAHDAAAAASPVAAEGAARASVLSKGDESSRIINDVSIPTPEAARRVGELRHEHGTPLWAKVVAPLSVIAAGIVAIHFGAVGVLTLGAGLVVSVLAHEVAHLAVLKALGDHTAEHAGSHSLNPFHHVDAVKTVILPALSLAISSAFLPFPILLGSGKAVDADFNNLRGPLGGPRSARNAFWVAAAGPLTNFALAGLAFGAVALLPAGGLLAGVAVGLAHMNLALGIFNLLPLPQLDGGKMLASALPEGLYAKWVYNPNVEKGYQGLFRRLYEGPTNLLTFIADKLGVKSQKGLNLVANGVTFAALAAFYAVAYVHFAVAVPLLFLALPCTYDYWCIREKVRSEAAVKDVMDIFSQWSSVIAQIAEDRGMASEVSLFETEHAMKNALETLIDEMMAKDDFRAMSDDEKMAAIMAAYPDKAADFLKDKVFTEGADTKEKILEVLRDPRNGPFYDRLKKWFGDHDIFKRWDNPKYEGKLRDQMKDADKPKSKGQGGFGTPGMLSVLALVGLGSAFFPELAHHAPVLAGAGMLGMLGMLTGGGSRGESKFQPRPGDEGNDVRVRFAEGTNLETARGLMAPFAGAEQEDTGNLIVFRVPAATPEESLRIARAAAASEHVEKVSVSNAVHTLLNSAAEDASQLALPLNGDVPQADGDSTPHTDVPSPTFTRPVPREWHAKLRSSRGHMHTHVTVVFASGIQLPIAKEILRGLETKTSVGGPSPIVFRVTAANQVEAAEIARDLAKNAQVASVGVTAAVYHRLTGHNPPSEPSARPQPADEETPAEAPRTEPAAEPAAPEASAPAAAPTEEELAAAHQAAVEAEARAQEAGDGRSKVGVREGAAQGVAGADLGNTDFLVQLADGLSDEVRERVRADMSAMSHVLRANFREDGTLSLGLRFDVDDAVEVAKEIAKLKSVKSVTTSLAVRDRMMSVALPAKIASHGKEHWSTTGLLVGFGPQVPQAEIAKIFKEQGETHLFRHGDLYVLNARDAKKAAEIAKALAAETAVASVEVHPNLAAALENRLTQPYPKAESFDPAQAVLIQFKSGTSDEDMKAYAEQRRLRLVYPKFRGMEGLALVEVLFGGDARITRQMLIDEMLEDGSKIEEVKPFKEQPGEPVLEFSPEAVARAQARRAAALAAEEAKRHVPRRDVQADWLNFLQTRKLNDGTTLNDKQVQALAEFLKPVAKGPGETRPPVVARTEEVKRMLPIVTSPRGMRNSVILVGGAGTGKTAVAEGLAEMIEDAEHASANDGDQFLQFQRLKGRWLVELDINKVLSAEDPIKVLNAVLDILPRFNDANPGRGNEVIVLMDEIQKFFLDNQGQKIANILKGPLRDGKISVIATTTDTEYKKFIESDDAFRRRLEKIDVAEPNVAQTTRILRAMKGWLQKIHDAVVPDEALVAAAKLTDQFDKTNFNPDKSIKAVQDGAELSRPENLRAAVTLDIRETWNDLTVAVNEARQTLLDKGIASTLALPIEAYNKIADLIKKAEALYAEREAIADGQGRLTVDVVKRVIAQKTGIASGQLNMGEEDASRYNDMEKTIGERVINQDPALTAIANAIRRNKAGLSNPNRPMGKFLLTGPTGVGKTYLAKELARFLFNDPEAMIRMDMSEYMEEHTAQRLTGSPPGYVGYGEGGQLTEAVRKKPYSVILFDEVEKAHPKVFDVLLQILDDGRLTDGQGRTIDFKNTVILMTSNAGMGAVDGEKYAALLDAVAAHNASVEEKAAKTAEIEAAWDAEIDASVAEHLKAAFRPEFLNRLDEDPRSKNKWIRVNRLRAQDTAKIAKIQVGEFAHLLADRHDTDLIVDPSVITFLSKEGFSHLYGARPMTAAIEKHIVDPMAKWILEEAANGHNNVRGGLITVSYDGQKIVFKAEVKPAKDIQRASLKDASASMAAEVFTLIEGLVGEGGGEEPSEGLFDRILRSSRPAPAAQAKAETAPAVRAFFAPDSSLVMPDGARVVAALHNKAKAADASSRAEIKAVTEAVAAAGWTENVTGALTTPAGQPGEGWLKQIVAFAKDRAEKAAVEKPVEIVSAVDGDHVRVLIHSDAELSDADKAYLAAHFTGAAPASYEAAQQIVDNLNLNGGMTRNHNLLDLYRRLKDIPGARMGYASGSSARGGKGTDLWLDVRKEEPKPVEAPALPKTAAPSDGKATPYQEREMAKTRELLMRFVDQSRLKESDQDGVAIRVAAAESYARLATPADLEVARAWIAENEWAKPGKASMALTAKNAWVMTATLILKRFGGVEDIRLLEAISGNVTQTSHYEVPLHNAFVDALGALYAQAGLAEVRAAAIRVAQNKPGHDSDIKKAIARALGHLGYPADLDVVKGDGEGVEALYRRMGMGDELRAEFFDEAKWNKIDAERKNAVLALVGDQTNPSDETFQLLAQVLRGQRAGDRPVKYRAAQAWANLAARTGRTRGLGAAISAYFSKHGIKAYEGIWGVLYAYVLAAEQAGGADVLPALESIMKVDPGSIASNHEQMYFSTPEAWAKALIRSGKYAEYSRATLGEDGGTRPSILMQMLTDKSHPMMVAGALRAIGLARDPFFKAKAGADGAAVPEIDHNVPQSTSGGGYGGYHGGYPDYAYGQRHSYLMRRWERDLAPM
jgi:ATP-dependent Clp protease ATP-binding subunit ClpC